MSLTSAAAPIWNEIAQTQELKTAWAKKAFRLDGMAMAELEDEEWKALKATHGSEVASAAVSMKPFLLENEAISRYTQAHPSLAQALPEVTSISEAVMLASQDYPLNPEQQNALQTLLQQMLKSSRPT